MHTHSAEQDVTAEGGSLVAARNLRLKGQWGPVFGPVSFDIDSGGVTIIQAATGAARTSLMMALSGRMKLTDGWLRVLGHVNDPRATFADATISCFDELDGILPSVTVRDLVTEQLRWNSRWYQWVPPATTSDLQEMCGYLFDDRPLPPIDAFIPDIPEIDQMLLRIAVANTKRPPLVVVGRTDHIADDDERFQLMEKLVKLGRDQSVITADVNGNEFKLDGVKVVELPQLLGFAQRSADAAEVARSEEIVRESVAESERKADDQGGQPQ